jgi:hypothetical protein
MGALEMEVAAAAALVVELGVLVSAVLVGAGLVAVALVSVVLVVGTGWG